MHFLRVLGSFQIGAGCFGGFVPELSNFLFFYLFLYQKKKKNARLYNRVLFSSCMDFLLFFFKF